MFKPDLTKIEDFLRLLYWVPWVHFVILAIDATTTSMSSPTLSPTPTKRGGQKMPFRRANLTLLMDYLGCPFWRLQPIDIRR